MRKKYTYLVVCVAVLLALLLLLLSFCGRQEPAPGPGEDTGASTSTAAPETTEIPVITDVPETTEVTQAEETTAPTETEPEETEPEETEPEEDEPEESKPKETKPKETEPKETEPKVTEPEVTEPEVTEPEVTEPEVTEPEVTEPEVTEPEVTEPEVTEPEVTEPEVTEPEVTEPEVTEPEETEPEDDYVSTGTVVSTKSVNLKVMSFNIRSQNDSGARHWDARKEALCDFLNNSGADIICMQEGNATQRNYLADHLAEKYGYYNTDSGNPIAYDKTTWDLIESGRFWLSETPDVPSKDWGASQNRICITALLENKTTGARIMVFNTHLDHKSLDIQEMQMAVVLERIAQCEYPVYLCGDFNCERSGSAYKNAAALLQDAQLKALDSDTGSSFTQWGTYDDEDLYVIDYILFSKDDIVPLTFDICNDRWSNETWPGENYLSDHNPITSTIRLIYELKKEYPEDTGNGFDGPMDTQLTG